MKDSECAQGSDQLGYGEPRIKQNQQLLEDEE